MVRLLFIFTVGLFFISCSSEAGNNDKEHRNLLAVNDIDQYTPPPPGTVVAADSIAVTNDPLNHFTFTVKIVTNEYSSKGTYAIQAAFGPNNADGMFTMPKGGGNLKPILHKGKEPYTYIIGFEYRKKFYDYYSVAGSKVAIEIKNIQAYSFQ